MRSLKDQERREEKREGRMEERNQLACLCSLPSLISE
jgi:hypothetical protein